MPCGVTGREQALHRQFPNLQDISELHTIEQGLIQGGTVIGSWGGGGGAARGYSFPPHSEQDLLRLFFFFLVIAILVEIARNGASTFFVHPFPLPSKNPF